MRVMLPASGGRSVRGTRFRVLVVDDDEDSAVAVGELLRCIGHDVRLAHDGDGALRVVAEMRPDLVVLDIGLPGRNGYEVARELRDRFGDDVMLVALSGCTNPGYLARSRAAGLDRHLVKPTSLAELRDIFADLEERHPRLDTVGDFAS